MAGRRNGDRQSSTAVGLPQGVLGAVESTGAARGLRQRRRMGFIPPPPPPTTTHTLFSSLDTMYSATIEFEKPTCCCRFETCSKAINMRRARRGSKIYSDG